MSGDHGAPAAERAMEGAVFAPGLVMEAVAVWAATFKRKLATHRPAKVSSLL